MHILKQKRFFRNMIRLFSLIILVWVIVSATKMVFSITPPDGNKTLNSSGRFNDDVDVVSIEDEPIPQDSPENLAYTFLLAGKDKVADNTDTIMLVYFNVTDKRLNILNIPRDTMLETNRLSKKINSSFQIGGIELLEKDIASLTGFYVNRYVLFNVEGIEKIIDAIGGVYFDVPQNMNYSDPTQNLYIHLKKGYQHLSGEEAVHLARYRNGYTDGDIGRINIQQQLIIALAKQALKPENILKLPEIVKIINENIDTDIDFGNLIWLVNEAREISLENISTDIIPGVAATKEGLSYWLPFENELLDIINGRYNPLDEPISAENIKIVSYPENKNK